MYFGELAEKSNDYRLGHEMGVIRAFDTAISRFERPFPEESYKTEDVIKMLKQAKEGFLEYCRVFGEGLEEEQEEECLDIMQDSLDFR